MARVKKKESYIGKLNARAHLSQLTDPEPLGNRDCFWGLKKDWMTSPRHTRAARNVQCWGYGESEWTDATIYRRERVSVSGFSVSFWIVPGRFHRHLSRTATVTAL